MAVSGMNHFTILTDDVDRTIAFYRELLGLTPGRRPAFAFPGAWLYAGGMPILHVVGGRARDELRPGVIDHMAFTARGLARRSRSSRRRASTTLPAPAAPARGSCSSSTRTARAWSSTSTPRGSEAR